MSDDYNPLLPSNAARKFPYKYVTRYCPGGTEDSPCGKPFMIQLNARSSMFISASTHVRPTDTVQSIVANCPQCGIAIDRAWLDNCYVDRPEPIIHGRDG
jgi:hypothetical protein